MSLPDIRKERTNYQHYPITDRNTTLSYQSADAEAYDTISPAYPKTREDSRRSRSGRYERRSTMLNTALWGLYIFAIGGAAFNAVFRKSTYEITTNHGKFAARPSNAAVEYVPEGATTPYSPLAKGETHTQVALNEFQMTDTLTKDDIHRGRMLLINEENPVTENGRSDTIRISDTMNGYYALVNQDIRLDPEAVEALNDMMEAYGNLTGYGDFVVYGTTETFTGEGSCCPEYFPESQTGCTVDLAVSMGGGLLPYDGEDVQGWIVDHCAEYGFIVRYPENKASVTGKGYIPWHLRYVGKVHAAAMAKNNLCFDEYISFIRRYTYDDPLLVTVDDVIYQVFFTKAEEDITHVQRFLDGGYEVSGNNTDGFIATIWKNN